MTAKFNFTAYQGADFEYTLTLKNDDGTLIDLTGYTFRGDARASYDSEKELFSFVFNILDQTTNQGQVEITLPNNFYTTLMRSEAKFIYDIEMESPSNKITKVLVGVVTVIPRVTR
jgi:hypothetical protein